MKGIKHFTKIILLLLVSLCLYSCLAKVPVDVVMVDNELYFVLEEEYEVSSVSVAVLNRGAQKPFGETMWFVGQDVMIPVKERKYPELKQIKYGQKFKEFPIVNGPAELQKNVEYLVKINMGGKFAGEPFILTEDNKVIMTDPAFERQKNRTYSVTVDKNGDKTLVPQPISKE